MSEHIILAGFVIWLFAAALYIVDTLITIINKIGGDS